jgi:RNA polymerase sigma-70 factor (ECF subfamily)
MPARKESGQPALVHDDDRPALVERARQGDRAAFEQLYRLYVGPVYRFIGSRLRDPHLTDDATAETFLQAWRDLPRLKDPARFESWLLQIAHRRAIDQVRANRQTVPLEHAESLPDGRRLASPEQQGDANADIELVRSALDELPEPQRTVITLRYLFHMSHEEIAAQLGRSNGAVRALRQRALARLRRSIARSGELRLD